MSEKGRPCLIIFIILALSSFAFAQPAPQSPRPADQPADLSTVEQETPVGIETTDEITPQNVKRDHEPLPQIKKKADDFDPRYQPGVHYIEHPMAAKGLYLIDKNKVYYYRVKPTETNQEASMRLGSYNPSNLKNPSYPDITFDSIYSNNIPIILYDNEYDIFKKFGRFGYKWGTGLYLSQGHGEFVEAPAQQVQSIDGQGPPEQFTFFMFPFNLGAIYHFEYFKNQWVIPYVEGALDAFCFGEMRDDNVNKFGAAFGLAGGAHASGGVAIPMGHDARSFLDLDREYGITRISFVAEFREYVGFEAKWNFSAPVIDAGFSVNY